MHMAEASYFLYRVFAGSLRQIQAPCYLDQMSLEGSTRRVWHRGVGDSKGNKGGLGQGKGEWGQAHGQSGLGRGVGSGFWPDPNSHPQPSCSVLHGLLENSHFHVSLSHICLYPMPLSLSSRLGSPMYSFLSDFPLFSNPHHSNLVSGLLRP